MNAFKPKFILIFLVLVVGIIGAYFIISGVSSVNNPGNENLTDMNQLENSGDIFSENISASLNGNGSDGSLANSNQEDINLTHIFANSFFNQVQASMGGSSNPQNLIDSKDAISQGMIGDIGKLAPQLKTITDIENSKLKITYDNSKDSKIAYFKSANEVVKKDYYDAKPDNYVKIIVSAFGENNPTLAAKASEIYKNLSNDFAKISVPSGLVGLHKKMIVYYKNLEIVYKSMTDSSTDPIKGYAALEMFNSLLSEGDSINNDFITAGKEI